MQAWVLPAALLPPLLCCGCVLDWAGEAPRPDAARDAGTPDRSSPLDLAPDLSGHDAFVDTAPPPNQTCKAAQPVQVSDKTVVDGDTTYALDEHPTLQCYLVGDVNLTPALKTAALKGPQVYYSWGATKGKWYKLTLHPKTTQLHLYVFNGGACSLDKMSAACQNDQGQLISGQAISTWHGEPRALYHQAMVDGSLVFAVDSDKAVGGPFSVTLEPIVQPVNTRCKDALPLPLDDQGKASVSGEVGPRLTPNEFTTVHCGLANALIGPQVYYTVSLEAAKTYRVSIAADSAVNLYAYIFSGACDKSKINDDCKSNGTSGATTGAAANGLTESLTFKAPKKADYTIAVDSQWPQHFGGFTLKVERQP